MLLKKYLYVTYLFCKKSFTYPEKFTAVNAGANLVP